MDQGLGPQFEGLFLFRIFFRSYNETVRCLVIKGSSFLGFLFFFLKGEPNMETWEMRKKVKAAYDSVNWNKKVDKMSEQQLYCVYESLKKRGKIR